MIVRKPWDFAIKIRGQHAARVAVATWLRTKARHEDHYKSYGMTVATPDGEIFVNADVRGLLHQLATDAEHSSLLMRLFAGQKPCTTPPGWDDLNPCPDEQGEDAR